MKTALCIFGQPRTMEFCAPSVKTLILDKYHPDVFVCSDSQGEKIKELYNPVNIQIYELCQILEQLGNRKSKYGTVIPIPGWPQPEMKFNISSIFSGLFMAMKCKEMVEEQELKTGKYDVIIVTRFDVKLLYIQPITRLEENTFCIPRIDAHQWEADENGIHWHLGYSVHTWWGSSDIAKTLLNMYSWTDEYFYKVGVFCTEMMLKQFCDEHEVNIEYTDVTQMIIKGDKDHPRSCSMRYGQELSATHYPEYLSPPLPKSGHRPVPQYTWGGEPARIKPYFSHPPKQHRKSRFLHKDRHHKS